MPKMSIPCKGLCVRDAVRMHACRAVQCQKFDMALLLLGAGADPMYTCATVDGDESLPPLTAVMRAIPAGEQPLINQLITYLPANQVGDTSAVNIAVVGVCLCIAALSDMSPW